MKKVVLFLLILLCRCLPFEMKPHPIESYKEKHFVQYIDHFNYGGQAGPNGQFKQRYLISDKYWDKKSGPILFYTGNEGPITTFWENTGFIFELALKFSGLVLFGEHRYYGKSLPFGNSSYTPANIGFLSIEQALADFATLVKFVKKDMLAENCPVYALGGSYGGILTGYMRYKYPHIISGGVASSAPFMTLAGKRPRFEFFHDVTEAFRQADKTCPNSVQIGFNNLLDEFSSGAVGVNRIKQTFRLCSGQFSKLSVEKHIVAWIRNAFSALAMFNNPYPTKYFVDLPANPVNVACSYMAESDKLVGLANVIKLLYGSNLLCHDTYTEYVSCSDPTGCGNGHEFLPWDYQACTELMLPGGSNNKTDMFPALDFTLEMKRHYCSRRWGLGYSRQTWLGTNYFSSLEDIKETSRIIFTNGDLDPWTPGGVLVDLSDSLIAVIIEGGTHHLDLRASNPADPIAVVEAREKITKILGKWMHRDRLLAENILQEKEKRF